MGYLDIPALLRKGILTESQYKQQLLFATHDKISEMLLFRLN